jgi:hypothetical protein
VTDGTVLLIAGVIQALGVIAAIVVTIVLSLRTGKTQERNQRDDIAYKQPALEPTGASMSLNGDPHGPYTLDAYSQRIENITLQNQGASTPSEIEMVLFPPAYYLKQGIKSPLPPGTLWYGLMSGSPGPEKFLGAPLKRCPVAVPGAYSIIPERELFAPSQDPEAAAGDVDFRTARLTITFRDRLGRRLCSVFDLDPYNLDKWHWVDGPKPVDKSLTQLIAEARRATQPPKPTVTGEVIETD